MSTDPAQDAAVPAGMSATAFSDLFQAVNGLRNRRALVALIGCTVGGVLLAGLLLALSGALGMLASVLAFLVYLIGIGTGVNAAGLLHMDHARGISPRSTADALVYGLMCIPKLIVLGIALFLVELAVFLVIALVLVVCKIPFVGPLLFTVVFPVSVVVAGITIFSLFLCWVLSLPAIWQGASIMRALSQTLAIARRRLVEAILLLTFVWLLSFAVALIIFSVLGAGLLPTLGLSASIVGFSGLGGGLGSVMGMAQNFGGEGAGHAVGGVIGLMVLWAVAASLVLQVYLLGLCLVYLRVTEGLDLSGTEEALRQKLDEARKRAAELGEKAHAAANRETAAAAPAPSSSAAAAASAAATVAPFAASPAPYTPPPAHYATPPAPYRPPPPSAAPAPYPPPAPYTADLAPLAATDIDLSFDDTPPPVAPPAPPSLTPSYSVPPVYVPPPVRPPVAAPAMPQPTTCPQCLSPITADDVFCGVCGYRLK